MSDRTEASSLTQEAIDFFASQPECANIYYELIGKIVIQWAKIEILVDNAVEHLSPLVPKPDEYKPTMSLKKKIAWIRTGLKNHPHLSENEEYIGEIIRSLKRMSGERNHIIHSNHRGFAELDGVIKLKIENRSKEFFYTTADLEKFLGDLVDLHTLMWGFTTMVVFLYPITIPQMSKITS